MRIAGDTLRRNYLSRYEKNYSMKYDSERKIYSGRSFDRGSENPIDAARALRVRRSIAEVETYQANLKTADTIYTNAESSMLLCSEILQKVYEKLVEGAHGTRNPDDLTILSMEIDNYAEEMVQSFNIDIAGRKVFGGMNNETTAFAIESDISGGKYVTYNGVPVNSSSDPQSFPYPGVSYLDIGIGMATNENTGRIDDQTALPITFNGAECSGCGSTANSASIDLDALRPGMAYTFDVVAGGNRQTINFVADLSGDKTKNIENLNDLLAAAFRNTPQVGTDGAVTGGDGYWTYYPYEPVPLDSNGNIKMSELKDNTYYSLKVNINGKSKIINFKGGNSDDTTAEEGMNKTLRNLDSVLKDNFGDKVYVNAYGQIKYGNGPRDNALIEDELADIDTAAASTITPHEAAPLGDGTTGVMLDKLKDDVLYSVKVAVLPGDQADSYPKLSDYHTITFDGSSDAETARENFEDAAKSEFSDFSGYMSVNEDGLVKVNFEAAGYDGGAVSMTRDFVTQYVDLTAYEPGKTYAININKPVLDKAGKPVVDENGEYVYDNGNLVYFTAGNTPEDTANNINDYIARNDIYGSSKIPEINENGFFEYDVDGANIEIIPHDDSQEELPFSVHNGHSKNIMQLVLDAGELLRKGDQQMVARYADLIYAAQSNLSIAIADLGTHAKYIEFSEDRLSDIHINLNEKQNDLESTDLSSEITNWKVLESIYNASLQMGASVLSQSIFNYIS